MVRVKRFIGLAVVLLAGLSAACTNIYVTPTPSAPTATLPPLATFTPRYTATPLSTATPRPTLTFTPSPSPIPPTPSNTPTPSPTPPVIGQVSSVQNAVNMREGPGVTYTIIEGVPNNTELIVLAANEEQTWYNVRLEDGTEGWIAADLIFLPPTATPLPSATAEGLVLEVSGTPVATSLLGGEPITATPSFTPTQEAGFTPSTRRTPGTVTATLTPTTTPLPAESIPTVTPEAGDTETPTPESDATNTPRPSPTFDGTVQPPRTGYDVLAYCEQFNEVPPPLAEGTTIDIFWGWIAATETYLQQHVSNVVYEVRLDGELLDDWRLYANEPRQRADGNWEQYWFVPITEPLPAGTHTITYRVTWRNSIFDGYEAFGPGTENEIDTGSCTFEIR